MIFLFLGVVLSAGEGSGAQQVYRGEAPHLLAKRYALVIGIGRYQSLFAPLPNAEADARLIAGKLRSVGFDDVQEVITSRDSPVVRLADLRAAIYDLRRSIEADRIAEDGRAPAVFVYIAGHGFTWKGHNYLAPSDFTAEFAEDIPSAAMPLLHIVRAIVGAKPLTLFIVIDACRDLPFDRLPTLDGLSASFSPGALLPQARDIEGATVLFSTLTGLRVPDGPDGGNSPFAEAFAQVLDVPDSGDVGDVRYVRAFEGVYDRVSQKLRGDDRYKPEMRRVAPYHLPLVRTIADFELEKSIWETINDQYALDFDEAREAGTAMFAQEFAASRTVCALESFLPENAASYFGAAALKIRRDFAAYKCRDEPLTVTPSNEEPPPGGGTSGTVGGTMQPINLDAINDEDLRQQFASWQRSIGQTSLSGLVTVSDRTNFRSSPRLASDNVRVTLPAGAPLGFQRYVDTDREWAAVTHPNLGPGYIARELVAPASVPITTSVTFLAGSTTPTPLSRFVLEGQIGWIGPGVLLDFTVRYSSSDQQIGLARALEVAKVIKAMANERTRRSDAQLFPLLKADDSLPADEVSLELQVIPLNRQVYEVVGRDPAIPATGVDLGTLPAARASTSAPSIVPLTGIIR